MVPKGLEEMGRARVGIGDGVGRAVYGGVNGLVFVVANGLVALVVEKGLVVDGVVNGLAVGVVVNGLVEDGFGDVAAPTEKDDDNDEGSGCGLIGVENGLESEPNGVVVVVARVVEEKGLSAFDGDEKGFYHYYFSRGLVMMLLIDRVMW